MWDRDYLDLVEPATMTIRADGHGEIAFGATQARLDLDCGRSVVSFTWAGFDEMHEVGGSGSAELQDDGSLEIEFAYHLGDEAVPQSRSRRCERNAAGPTQRTYSGSYRSAAATKVTETNITPHRHVSAAASPLDRPSCSSRAIQPNNSMLGPQ